MVSEERPDTTRGLVGDGLEDEGPDPWASFAASRGDESLELVPLVFLEWDTQLELWGLSPFGYTHELNVGPYSDLVNAILYPNGPVLCIFIRGKGIGVCLGFWENVKKEILAQNTTQEWVCRKAGISYRTFRGWISLERLPSVMDAGLIAGALQVSVEYLLTGTDSADPWVREHRAFLDDCKLLDPATLSVVETVARTHADVVRERSKRA